MENEELKKKGIAKRENLRKLHEELAKAEIELAERQEEGNSELQEIFVEVQEKEEEAKKEVAKLTEKVAERKMLIERQKNEEKIVATEKEFIQKLERGIISLQEQELGFYKENFRKITI